MHCRITQLLPKHRAVAEDHPAKLSRRGNPSRESPVGTESFGAKAPLLLGVALSPASAPEASHCLYRECCPLLGTSAMGAAPGLGWLLGILNILVLVVKEQPPSFSLFLSGEGGRARGEEGRFCDCFQCCVL